MPLFIAVSIAIARYGSWVKHVYVMKALLRSLKHCQSSGNLAGGQKIQRSATKIETKAKAYSQHWDHMTNK